ncbi:hypothetical protein [Fusobacterium mortiferum]|uniref:hypothetical protein n=1 Tax=Fusobacterium mortiferum TaxID=850 RepID=UPI00158BECB9|nr:hypothetical protein [Fusobacterium mortiferum]
MSIERNMKYIRDEYDAEVARLERLNNFIKSEEFETSTDAEQKKLLLEKQETLAKYVSIIAEQIKYDMKKLQEKEYATDNYDDIHGNHFNK